MREAGDNEWDEERLRYEVLSTVYELSGAVCQRAVTGSQIGAALGLRYEDLFRAIQYLEQYGFLKYMDSGARMCITPKGLRYVEELAGRRRSLRESPDHSEGPETGVFTALSGGAESPVPAPASNRSERPPAGS